MSHRGMVFVFVLVLSACATAPAKGGGGGGEPFTEQAKAGAALYTEHCSECHGNAGQGVTDKGPRVVGLAAGALPLDPPADRKHRKEQFKTVMDVAGFAVKNMPPMEPGSLKEEDYWRILAFDLQANGVDLGDKHLDAELAKTLTIPR